MTRAAASPGKDPRSSPAPRPGAAARGRHRRLLVVVLSGGLLVGLLAKRARRRRPDAEARPPASAGAPWGPAAPRRSSAAEVPAGAAPRSRAYRRMRRLSRWVPAAAVIAAGLAAAVGVFAYASGTGVGLGLGSVATSRPVAIAPGTATHGLYPGGSGDVVATISNSNSFAVHLASLTLDTLRGTDGFAVDAAHADCNLDSLGFHGPQTDGGAAFVVPAGGTLHVDLAGAVSMAETAVDACQGATFTVYLEVGP